MHNKRRLLVGISWENNIRFCRNMSYLTVYNSLLLSVVIFVIILLAGDVHPNPGTKSSESLSSLYSTDLYNFLNLPNHLSTTHYNVQSIANKLDNLIAEFSYFDIVLHSPRLGCTMNTHRTNYSFLPSIHLSEKTELVIDMGVLFCT